MTNIDPFIVAFIYGKELSQKAVPIDKEVLRLYKADNYLSANDLLVCSQARVNPVAVINQHLQTGFGQYAAGCAFRGRSDALDTGRLMVGGVYDNVDRSTALLTPDSRLLKSALLRNNGIDFLTGKSDEIKLVKSWLNVPEKGASETPAGDNDVAKICKGDSARWALAAALMAAKDYGWRIYYTRQTVIESYSMAGAGDTSVEAIIFGKITTKEQALVAATLDTWRLPVVHMDSDLCVPGFAVAAKFGVFGYCTEDRGAAHSRDYRNFALRFIGGDVCGCDTPGFNDMTIIPSIKTYGLLRGVGSQKKGIKPFANDPDNTCLSFPYVSFTQKSDNEVLNSLYAFKFGWVEFFKEHNALYWNCPMSLVPMFVDFGDLPNNLYFGTNGGAVKSNTRFAPGSNYSIVR